MTFFCIVIKILILITASQIKGRRAHMKKNVVLVITLVIIVVVMLVAMPAGAQQKPVFLPMPDPGKKVTIGNGYYLIYGFDKRPKLGTVIMKLEVFTGDGKKDTALEIKGDAGMPSMSGAHETGDRAFTLSKKGDYLLPISIVMPGNWEIRLTVVKEGKVIFRGRHNFDV
jgi:hypothetical protein